MSKSIDKIVEAIDKQIERLKNNRSEILRIAADLESILEDGPMRGTLHKRTSKRAVNEQSLRAHVADVLKKRKKGLTLEELKDLVLTNGYKSNSNNFKGVLYQCIRNSPEFEHNSETGAYTLTTNE